MFSFTVFTARKTYIHFSSEPIGIRAQGAMTLGSQGRYDSHIYSGLLGQNMFFFLLFDDTI